MTKYLIIWKVVNSRIPDDMETHLKRAIKLSQMVQESMKAGKTKEWGTRPDGTRGYSVFEGSETDLALEAAKYGPLFEYEVYPILTVDQWMGILKGAAQTVQK